MTDASSTWCDLPRTQPLLVSHSANPEITCKEKRGDVAVVTYDDLTRRPVLCFFGGRNVVGVTAREPTVELPSPC